MKVLIKNNKKRLLIILSIIIVIIICIASIFIVNKIHENKIENEFKELAINYYENEFIVYMPSFLQKNGTLQITLSTLKQINKDVSLFEKNNCDTEKTYVTLTYNEKTNYDVETHMECE